MDIEKQAQNLVNNLVDSASMLSKQGGIGNGQVFGQPIITEQDLRELGIKAILSILKAKDEEIGRAIRESYKESTDVERECMREGIYGGETYQKHQDKLNELLSKYSAGTGK